MGIIKLDLANALFSKAQQRVLGLLYSQPHLTFHTNEIIRLAHSGSGAIQRELKKMSMTGLLITTRIGNQKHYQANRANPLFAELRSIVLKTFGLADVIQQVLRPIVSEIKIAFIYGSLAKQEDQAASDIDLMIICDTLSYSDLFPLLEKAETRLNRPIHPTFYSASDWQRKIQKENHFLKSVIHQSKIFVIGTEDELKQLGKFDKNKKN